MSLIGQLEQLNLSLVLQGIETYAKTGLLVVKQEVQWIELYFRDGRLVCIGPTRPDLTLGDRLIQAGVISPAALQSALIAVGVAQPSETRLALALMDLGHVSHEGMRAWAMNEASRVIQILHTWQSGGIFFEDGTQPPAERLLVALSPASLLPPTPAVAERAQHQQNEQSNAPSQIRQERRETIVPPPQSAPQLNAAQIMMETPPSDASSSSLAPSFSTVNMFSNADAHALPPLSQATRINQPQPPMRIDTSFMRPEMVLKPLDLSALRERSPQLQITPDQWRVLTRVDGRTTLQVACQELGMPADLLCQVAGELIALGLIHVAMPQTSANQLAPGSPGPISNGSNNGYLAQGYAANSLPAGVATPPSFGSTGPFETKSQWGNGGTGATFVPGHGWVANPQPMQPLQVGAPLYTTNGVYAPAGSGR